MRVSWIIFLFLLFTSSFLTSAAYRPDGYLGCFRDGRDRILQNERSSSGNNRGDQCKNFCSSLRYRYAGTESGYECFCGHVIRIKVPSYSCNDVCPGNYLEMCGGHWKIDIYDTWHCVTKPCKNDAKCTDIDANNYQCICSGNWTGKHCEQEKTTTRTQSTTTTTTTATIKTTSTVTESGTNYIISSENMNEYSSDSGALNATDSPKKNNGDGIDHMVTMCVLLPLALFALLVGIALFIRRRRRQKIETQQVIYHGEGSIPNIYANVSMTDNQQLALEKHAVRNVPEKKQICVSNKSTKPKAEDDVEDSGYSSYSVNMQFDNEQGQKSYDHIPTLIKAQVDKTYSHLSLPIHEPKYINITHDTYSHIENSSLQRVVISDDENDDVTYNKLEMNGTLKTGKRTNGYIIDNSDYDHTEVGLTPPQEEDCYSRANHLETDGQRPESSPLYANLP